MRNFLAAIANALKTILQTTWKLVKVGGVWTMKAVLTPVSALGSVLGGGHSAPAASNDAVSKAATQTQAAKVDPAAMSIKHRAASIRRVARYRAEGRDISKIEDTVSPEVLRHLFSLSTDECHALSSQPVEVVAEYLAGNVEVLGCRSIREVTTEAAARVRPKAGAVKKTAAVDDDDFVLGVARDIKPETDAPVIRRYG